MTINPEIYEGSDIPKGPDDGLAEGIPTENDGAADGGSDETEGPGDGGADLDPSERHGGANGGADGADGARSI